MSLSDIWARRSPHAGRRLSALSLLLGATFGVVPFAVAPLAVAADGPTGIGFTLLGCRGSESLVPPAGPYLCPDAYYVDGNLGKKWQELDLVPMRLVATATGSAPATQTYQVAVTADALGKGVPGFDYLSLPVLDAARSSAACTAATVSPSGGAGATISPGIDSVSTTIYRVLSVTQAAGTTCVYDWYQRLALGSHSYPGSALHSDLATVSSSGGAVTGLTRMPGAKTIPLPVDKTAVSLGTSASLAATQGSGYGWSLSRSTQPASLDLANTCNPDGRSTAVDITVAWTRTPSVDGQLSVVVQLFASNSSHRSLDVDVADELHDATGTPVGHNDTGSVAVPASSSHYLVGTSTYSFPAGASASYSDTATAAWSDPVTLQLLGTGAATAEGAVQTVSSGANATAVLTDATSLSGSGLQLSVDSVSLGGGSFGSYAPGSVATGPVDWTSPQLSGDGSATFHVTVSANGPTAASGTLSNTAALLGSGGLTATSPVSVTVSSAAQVALAIAARIPDVLTGSQTATFAYTVSDAHGAVVAPASITFAAGQTSGSTALSGLAPGSYTVHQASPAGWAAQSDQTVAASLPHCAATVQFSNAQLPSQQGTPAPTPTPTPTPTPSSGLFPATSVAPPSGGTVRGAVQAARVATPFTGADLPFPEAGVLLLLGSTLTALGWRRARRP